MAVYDNDVNRIRWKKYTEKIDLGAREEEQRRSTAIQRIEKVKVTMRRKEVVVEGQAKLLKPVTKYDVIMKLWNQHYIRVALDRVVMHDITDAGSFFLKKKTFIF